MTNLLTRLRELEAKATPGPFTTNITGCIWEPSHEHPLFTYHEPGMVDAKLLCELRNALPKLLDRLEKLEAVVEAVQTHEQYGEDTTWKKVQDALAALEDKE